MEWQLFRSGWDGTAWWASVLGLMLLFGGACVCLMAALQSWPLNVMVGGACLGGAIVLILVALLLTALSPLGYAVDRDGIVIRRLAPDVRIRWDVIQSVEALDASAMEGTSRRWASGGLLGYYGVFQNPTLGVFHAYMNHRHHPVVVRTRDGNVVLAPDRREEFLAAMPGRSAGNRQ